MAKNTFQDISRVMPEVSSVSAAMWHTTMLEKLSQDQILGYFTAEELVECEAISHTQRKNEWIASRMALKRLLIKDGLLKNPKHMSVRKTNLGAPYIVIYEPGTGRYLQLNCSLSHKDKIVFAAYAKNSKQRVGIDLEKRSWRIPCLRRKFVSEKDYLVEKGDYIGDKTVLWTFKEATSKVRGTGFRCGFCNIVCNEKSLGLCEISDEENTSYIGHYSWFGQYAISIVTDIISLQEELHSEPHKYGIFERLARARRLKKLQAERLNARKNQIIRI